MALTTKRIGKPEAYPWGHMVRVDFLDRDTGRLQHEELSFQKDPDEQMIAVAVEALRVSTEARLAIVDVDPPQDDVVALKAEVAQLKSAQTAASAAMAAATADKAAAVAMADVLAKDMAVLVATNEALVKENEELKKAAGGK